MAKHDRCRVHSRRLEPKYEKRGEPRVRREAELLEGAFRINTECPFVSESFECPSAGIAQSGRENERTRVSLTLGHDLAPLEFLAAQNTASESAQDVVGARPCLANGENVLDHLLDHVT